MNSSAAFSSAEDLPPACTLAPGGILLRLRVTPKGGRDRIEGISQLADGQTVLKLRVAAAPEDGKANAAVLRLLARALGLRQAQVTLQHGASSRQKSVFVQGDAADIGRRLAKLLQEIASSHKE